MADGGAGADTLRLDRLLVYLRFARTRSAAQKMIEKRALRRNRNHVRRTSEMVAIGDVLTLVVGDDVRIIEITALPKRRASPALAKSFYSELDRGSDQSLDH
ncbi:S4 domain-containing protein [uncultured Erythrobacter sp.]|uniref:S4 domain-containing protein n=1 Tax=uncultured Erythrobacter sp. TaxID=263913 RepID=UPI00263479B2|nr:S4 domain-containing protein [uncultured Erythrobacter sp.]